MMGIARRTSHYLSLEKQHQLISTYLFPKATQGWLPMYQLMNKTNQQKWQNLINQLQSLSLKAPSNASYSIINKLSKIPTLVNFMKKQTLKIIKKINVFKSVPNSFTEKIPITDPNTHYKAQGLRKRNLKIIKTSEKSPTNLFSIEMENLKITDVADLGPKIDKITNSSKQLPYISHEFDLKNRRVLMNCATGSLSRKSMHKTNKLISNKCPDCNKKIEDNDHMLNCNKNNSYCLKSDVNNFLNKNDIKLNESHIFNKYIDFTLGIGSIQKIINRKSKIWHTISSKINSLQKIVLKILKRKNRDGETYHDRALKLV